MKANQFRVLYPDFFTRFQAIILYFDDTLDEDVLMIFDELEVKLTARRCKFRSRERDSSLQLRADHEFPTCVTCHERKRMQTMTKQTNSYSSPLSLSFSGLRLSIIRENNHRKFAFFVFRIEETVSQSSTGESFGYLCQQ